MRFFAIPSLLVSTYTAATSSEEVESPAITQPDSNETATAETVSPVANEARPTITARLSFTVDATAAVEDAIRRAQAAINNAARAAHQTVDSTHASVREQTASANGDLPEVTVQTPASHPVSARATVSVDQTAVDRAFDAVDAAADDAARAAHKAVDSASAWVNEKLTGVQAVTTSFSTAHTVGFISIIGLFLATWA
jgi:hypothetical protein